MVLNRSDEPVIGISADIGASWRGALHRYNEMRVAQFGHNETSSGRMHCDKRPGTDEVPKYRHAECTMQKTSEMNWVTMAGNDLGTDE
jgi:hypothetical protein